MAKGIALVNGRNFAHQDLILNVGGVPLVSMSNITTTDRVQAEFSYGTQQLPVGYGKGRYEQIELTFEISLLEYRALQKAAPDNDFKRIDPFDIPLTSDNPNDPGQEIIKNVIITEGNRTSDSDTTDIKVTVTAIASHIQTIQ